jgi:hypothetical protein
MMAHTGSHQGPRAVGKLRPAKAPAPVRELQGIIPCIQPASMIVAVFSHSEIPVNRSSPGLHGWFCYYLKAATGLELSGGQVRALYLTPVSGTTLLSDSSSDLCEPCYSVK